ncbi:ABC transporter ATP-binding protein [Lentilactobacillus fungorum]|uniref:ABC transporter ATP-binding protein n=2 Tax=Lentilactobacillus fungorum TaxID=2201250 RepID=A0ABQ3W0F5_9LACO|nr:ABC transporter ATP-binding protein [Lentilactobacillus fungorum]GHP14488.1 ABC transporter ATP-binding protein [Lentilactobacillus fungorum]
MTNTIQVSNLEQGYGRTVVLKDINLTVTSGEILALIGPSGAGKTTLVSTIMGMLRPMRGQVAVLNTPMPNRPLLAKIGFMAQTDALYSSLTAQENLLFFGAMQGISRKKLREQIPHAAGIVNLVSDLTKQVSDYSGGMKRRLSLAIALVSDPEILILDEPTVGIDPELRQQIWHELHQLAAAGRTILLTTHVMEDAEEADEVMMIRNGEAIAQGTPAELIANYGVSSVEEVFLKAGRQQDATTHND